jgi:hypothetical protein
VKTRLLSLLFLAGLGGTASAATITYAGTVTGTEATNWRTAGVAKTMSISGSNVYGSSLGAVDWGNIGLGESGAGSGTFSWSYQGVANGQYGGDNRYPAIDNINTGGGDNFPGLIFAGGTATFTFGMEGTAANYTGKFVRVGIFQDILGADEVANDFAKTLRITGPGGADSGLISLRGGAVGSSTPEIYFFDIYNINPADVFTISAGNSGLSPQTGYIGPVSWDIAPVPEPSAALLGGIAALGLLQRRRRA